MGTEQARRGWRVHVFWSKNNDLFRSVSLCAFLRIRLPGFYQIGQKKKKEKDKTFHALSRSFPGARRCTSMLFSSSGGVEVERRGLGRATRASPSLSAWTTPPPARAHSLSTRRQGRDWKEDGSVLSAHAAESVAAWQRAPGQMPPAGSCPPCAQY